MAPSYKTNDPKGWGGDPRRGAAMGRRDIHNEATEWEGKVYLRRVPLDSGGYDQNGTYFGSGMPLWWYSNSEGTIDGVARAQSRRGAREEVLKTYPKARFFR